jgi:GTP-binding protein
MRYAPIAFITGQTGKNVEALLNHGQMLFKQSRMRIPTGQLNRLLRDAVSRNPPPMHANRRPKIYYGTQVGVQPPTLVLFCSDPQGIERTYQRYLLGAVRDQLHFEEVPIKLYLRKRQQSDVRDDIASTDVIEGDGAIADESFGEEAEVGGYPDPGEDEIEAN